MKSVRGFALIYFLLIMSVVFILISTLFSLGRRQLFTTQAGADRIKALYAAEAGLAMTMAELEKDANWNAGFTDKLLPSGNSTFTAKFSGTAPDSCVNNLLSANPADSYHGPNTVPANAAILVVTGQSGLSIRKIEALVVSGAHVTRSIGVISTGPISLSGDVKVAGREDSVDARPKPFDIHTNAEMSGVTVLQPPGGNTLEVSGQVTTSSTHPGAISLNGNHTVGGQVGGVGSKSIPDINIEALVNDHSSDPAPNLTTTAGVAASSQDSYYAGDLVHNGDLVLENDAFFVVDGNFTVNGSVRGSGTLIVGGNTELFGNADVTPLENESLSILSRGHLTLKGFNGQSYLESDSSLAADLEQTNFAMNLIQEELYKMSGLPEVDMARRLRENDPLFDTAAALISYHGHGNYLMNNSAAPAVIPSSRHGNRGAAIKLRDRFAGAVPGTTEAFLFERLQLVGDLFRDCRCSRDDIYNPDPTLRPEGDYSQWDAEFQGGYFDGFQSATEWSLGTPTEAQMLSGMRQAISAVQEFDFDRLGSANFKGLLYCEGAMMVKDDLNVLGSIVVNGDPNLPALVDPDTSKSYLPGELSVSGNSRIIAEDRQTNNGISNLIGSGNLDVKYWVNR